MFEQSDPEGGPSLKAWYSEAIGMIRVSSTPGGISLTADRARELRDELDQMIDRYEDGENDE